MATNTVDDFISRVGVWFSKLPSLPANWKETIVKITPWLALIFGALGVVFSLIAVGILTFVAPLVLLSGGFGTATGGPIAAILWFISSVLLLLSYKGVRTRKEKGWRFLYYSEAVSLLSSIVFFSISGVFWSLVAFYILYQIKSYYK